MSFETPTLITAAFDIDNTLREEGRDNDPRLQEFIEFMQSLNLAPDVTLDFGSATGRSTISHDELEASDPTFNLLCNYMAYRITDVGTHIDWRHLGSLWLPETMYPEAQDWDAEGVTGFLERQPRLMLQGQEAQSNFKRSALLRQPLSPEEEIPYQKQLQRLLNAAKLVGRIVVSSREFVDCLPLGSQDVISKGTALKKTGELLLARAVRINPLLQPKVFRIAGGDSNNDRELLAAADGAIIVGNANRTLKAWAEEHISPDKLYIASALYAQGLIEGLRYFGIEP